MKNRFRQHNSEASGRRRPLQEGDKPQIRYFSEEGLPTPDLIDDWLKKQRKQPPTQRPALDLPSRAPANTPPEKEKKRIVIIPILEPDEKTD